MVAGPAPSHRYVALDSLRGIAALGVVFHHIIATAGPASWPLFLNGRLFVDFFFVLSGFVIAASYGERLAAGFSLRRFALLRIGRVWPLHAVMVMAALALELAGWAFGSFGLSSQAPFAGTHSPDHILTSLFLLDGFIPAQGNFYSGASWSISVELLLYALAALAFRGGRLGPWLLVALALPALAGQLLGIDWPILTFSALRGITGFALGTGCWLLHRRLPTPGPRLASVLEALALGVLLGGMALVSPARGSALIALPAAAAVLVFASGNGGLSRLFAMRPWTWLGTISYSIYMVHPMVAARLVDVILLLSRRTGAGFADFAVVDHVPVKRLLFAPLPSTLVQLVIAAVVLAAAHFAWRWIEEPARLASRRLAAAL